MPDLVTARGGVEALSRDQRWPELAPALKTQAIEFFNGEVINWVPDDDKDKPQQQEP